MEAASTEYGWSLVDGTAVMFPWPVLDRPGRAARHSRHSSLYAALCIRGRPPTPIALRGARLLYSPAFALQGARLLYSPASICLICNLDVSLLDYFGKRLHLPRTKTDTNLLVVIYGIVQCVWAVLKTIRFT